MSTTAPIGIVAITARGIGFRRVFHVGEDEPPISTLHCAWQSFVGVVIDNPFDGVDRVGVPLVAGRIGTDVHCRGHVPLGNSKRCILDCDTFGFGKLFECGFDVVLIVCHNRDNITMIVVMSSLENLSGVEPSARLNLSVMRF